MSRARKKGVEERARTGLHLGGIPFGYQSCKLEGCDPEHTGSVHIIAKEAGAVRQLFRRYAKGTTTAVQLAAWMNDQGHRTRNMHRMGTDPAEPRYFTNASVRGVLLTPFTLGRSSMGRTFSAGSMKAWCPGTSSSRCRL